MVASGLEDIQATTLISDYRSKNLKIDRTTTGWEARSRATIPSAIFIIAFGNIFLIVGLLLGEATRGFLLDLVPTISDAFATYFGLTLLGPGGDGEVAEAVFVAEVKPRRPGFGLLDDPVGELDFDG